MVIIIQALDNLVGGSSVFVSGILLQRRQANGTCNRQKITPRLGLWDELNFMVLVVDHAHSKQRLVSDKNVWLEFEGMTNHGRRLKSGARLLVHAP
mmetsp:Transcript_9447/g.15449  ORF Transcript_9447/g.15449 Transcript_9447/m.15449 type:complete len:96 (-) Transcript_9447:851-1138(-)